MLTLFKERYEVLATLGSGGEAQIVKALDRQHGRVRGAEDPAGARRRRARGSARRGARAARAAAARGPAARARGLLRRRRLRRRDGLGRRHRPRDAAGRPRPPRSGAVERARLSRAGGRGAHAPALAVPAGHPRRRQAGQPDPHQGRPHQARRLRPVLRAERPRRRAGTPGLPRPGAGRRRQSLARDRRLRAGGHRVRAADRRAAGGRPARVGGDRPGAGRAARGRDPPRHGDGSGAPPDDPGRARRAPARRLGGRAADRRGDLLLLRHRGLDRTVGRRIPRRWPRRSCATTS